MSSASAVGAAITAAMRVHGPEPDARTLASAVGTRLGATECVITVLDERFTWRRHDDAGRRFGDDDRAHRQLVDAPPVSISIAPAAVAPEVDDLVPLAVVLAPRAHRLKADRLRRSSERDTRRLADHRWRATAEMEQERRRLERDLHDGAQHHLVAVRMALGIAQHEAQRGEPVSTDGLRRLLDGARDSLVDTARGVLPNALAQGGLLGALRSLDAGDLSLAIPPERFAPTVEATVYFITLEAINNARKHAPGSRIEVLVRETVRGVEFLVRDDGPGFRSDDEQSIPRSLLLRAAAVGGGVQVRSAPGAGTSVFGFVPVSAANSGGV